MNKVLQDLECNILPCVLEVGCVGLCGTLSINFMYIGHTRMSCSSVEGLEYLHQHASEDLQSRSRSSLMGHST